MGSSPLARGLLPLAHDLEPVHRIIPARAGFTSTVASTAMMHADHPRSRGVYRRDGRLFCGRNGSSPLARGLRRPPLLPDHHGRIIPARAGFTGQRWARRRPAGDHPRSRGVYDDGQCDTLAEEGSSPLARGLRGRWRRRVPAPRIIPARAGFTRTARHDDGGDGDHPRSRGVYWPVGCVVARSHGSSPLARGLHQGRRPAPHGPGIIPARAGFTPSSGPATTSQTGSSPLARGLRSARRA